MSDKTLLIATIVRLSVASVALIGATCLAMHGKDGHVCFGLIISALAFGMFSISGKCSNE
jgi:hypothetical protein